MSPTLPTEQLVEQITHMNRRQCIEELETFEHIPLDFDRKFLDQMSLPRLQHVLLAAYVTARRHKVAAAC